MKSKVVKDILASSTPREWNKGLAIFSQESTAYISVPFTWLLPEAKAMRFILREKGFAVKVGGPACRLMPDYLREDKAAPYNYLLFHNPSAMFTTKGCGRNCGFCGVSKIEGNFKELSGSIPQFRPIVCDSNFLMSSRRWFDIVINGLKTCKEVDFNQGLDSRLFTKYKASRIAEVSIKKVRLAWDEPEDEVPLFRAIELLTKQGIDKRKISVYCLVNYKDDLSAALYKAETLRAADITRPFFMRYQPLDTLEKNSYLAPQWKKRELSRFLRYWNNLHKTAPIPFKDFYPCDPIEALEEV